MQMSVHGVKEHKMMGICRTELPREGCHKPYHAPVLSCQLSLSLSGLQGKSIQENPAQSLLATHGTLWPGSVAELEPEIRFPHSWFTYLSTTKQGECQQIIMTFENLLASTVYRHLQASLSYNHCFMIVQILDAISHRTDKTSEKENKLNLRRIQRQDIQIWMDQIKVCISLLIFCSTRGTNYNHSRKLDTKKMFKQRTTAKYNNPEWLL